MIGNDVDGDNIIFNVLEEPLNGTVVAEGEVIVYTPSLNFNGTDQITYIVNDGQLDSEIGIITVFVAAVNDAPTANASEIILYEDNSISFTFDVQDVDNLDDELSIFIQDEIDFGIISISGTEATILPNQDISGDFSFTYQVLDGELFSNYSSISIQILPVNDPPEISNILNQVIDEDEILYYQISATDVDSEDLIFSSNSTENANITIDGQTLIVEPVNNFNGDIFIEISVSDDEFSDLTSFILNVVPVNDPPVISPFEIQSTLEDESITINIEANDIDGDDLIFWTSEIENVEINIDQNQINITPDLNWNGQLEILVSTTDGEFIDSQNITLDVIPVNDSPVISIIENQSIDEDSTFFYTLEATDVDGDDLIYSLNDIINAVSTLENDLITIAPEQDFNGQIEISVAVTDGELIDTTTFNLDVLPVNDSPILEEISDKEMDENEILEIDFLANDVDGDELSYDYFIISGYAQAAISNNQIIITPNQNWFGEIEVTFTVTDGEFFDQDNFLIQVLEVDDPPTTLI